MALILSVKTYVLSIRKFYKKNLFSIDKGLYILFLVWQWLKKNYELYIFPIDFHIPLKISKEILKITSLILSYKVDIKNS